MARKRGAAAVAPSDMAHVPEKVELAWPPQKWIDVHVLVAVSGGADSMALVRALLAIKDHHGGQGEVRAAHVNHGIHAAADADAKWVADQLRELGADCAVRRVDVRREATGQGDGVESAARTLRYAALQAIAEEWGARFVVTAHTADDQVETVLHRIVRGTGVRGLSGMRRERPLGPSTVLVRPLLDVARRDVLEYLAELGQAIREDPTNRDPAFTRNRIRHELLPLLRRDYNAQVDESVLRLARQAEELSSILQAQVSALLEEAVAISGQQIVVDVARLGREPEPLVREVLRGAWRLAGWPEQQMSDSAWRRLSDLLHADSTRTDLPGGVQVEVSREGIRLLRGRT